ncbi:hypothetical protein KSS87_010894 [Heliosperma pusillum]|nr:hypothetical protein KSS87_010894 [Heliosperma pusillum]
MWRAMFPMKVRYIYEKAQFATNLAIKASPTIRTPEYVRLVDKGKGRVKYDAGEVAYEDAWKCALELLSTKMTYFYCNKGLEMESTLSFNDTLFIRKLPYTNAREHCQQMNVGDVVILKDPVVSGNYLVRRLAALGGCEMASTNKDDKPFVMKPGQAWVLSDNNRLHPKESKDSRLYGPIWMSDILGRVIYRFRTPDDQGLVKNNEVSMKWDFPVYSYELDTKEMQRFTDNQKQTRGR